MNRSTIKELQKKYNMEFLRNPITQEGRGVYCDVDHLIPELDALADVDPSGSDTAPCVVSWIVTGEDAYRYAIECPTSWIDLWGWKDD